MNIDWLELLWIVLSILWLIQIVYILWLKD